MRAISRVLEVPLSTCSSGSSVAARVQQVGLWSDATQVANGKAVTKVVDEM